MVGRNVRLLGVSSVSFSTEETSKDLTVLGQKYFGCALTKIC